MTYLASKETRYVGWLVVIKRWRRALLGYSKTSTMLGTERNLHASKIRETPSQIRKILIINYVYI